MPLYLAYVDRTGKSRAKVVDLLMDLGETWLFGERHERATQAAEALNCLERAKADICSSEMYCRWVGDGQRRIFVLAVAAIRCDDMHLIPWRSKQEFIIFERICRLMSNSQLVRSNPHQIKWRPDLLA